MLVLVTTGTLVLVGLCIVFYSLYRLKPESFKLSVKVFGIFEVKIEFTSK